MITKNNGSLHICQINVSGLSNRSITAIDRFNFKFKNDILALQETLLDNSRPHLHTFHNLDTFSVNNSRGVSTSVAPSLFHNKSVNFKTQPLMHSGSQLDTIQR